jgi:hypothetical protein
VADLEWMKPDEELFKSRTAMGRKKDLTARKAIERSS